MCGKSIDSLLRVALLSFLILNKSGVNLFFLGKYDDTHTKCFMMTFPPWWKKLTSTTDIWLSGVMK